MPPPSHRPPAHPGPGVHPAIGQAVGQRDAPDQQRPDQAQPRSVVPTQTLPLAPASITLRLGAFQIQRMRERRVRPPGGPGVPRHPETVHTIAIADPQDAVVLGQQAPHPRPRGRSCTMRSTDSTRRDPDDIPPHVPTHTSPPPAGARDHTEAHDSAGDPVRPLLAGSKPGQAAASAKPQRAGRVDQHRPDLTDERHRAPPRVDASGCRCAATPDRRTPSTPSPPVPPQGAAVVVPAAP